MNAETLLRTNGAKAGELAETLGGAVEAVAKAIEGTAAPLAEMIEAKAETLAKGVEVRAVPLAEAVGMTVEALAKSVEERGVPLAEAVGGKVEVLADDLEEKLEQARKDVVKGVKEFKFGQREALVLGIGLGVFAAVWIVRKIDRQAAAARLRAAGSRVGDATQGLTSRVGQATQDLSGKASTLAGQAGDRMGQVVQSAGARANDVMQQVRGQDASSIDEAKQRLSSGAAAAEQAASSTPANGQDAGSGLDKDTRAAIAEAVDGVEQAQEATLEQARELGLSDGMKVVGFDGTDIGRVQEVREDVFVLDRPKGSDLLVPLTEVARIEGTVAYLRIDADRLVKMGWENA
jgi:hypothetical protein